MADEMTIGRLAKAAGVNVETVRYYQRRGLIEEPQKPLGGQRRYPATALDALTFVRRAQQLGFSLEEVKSLMVLDAERDCRAACVIAERKQVVIASRIAQLEHMRGELEGYIEACKRNKARKACPMLSDLRKPADL